MVFLCFVSFTTDYGLSLRIEAINHVLVETFSGFTLQNNFLVEYLMNVIITGAKLLLVLQDSAERHIVPGSPRTVLVY